MALATVYVVRHGKCEPKRISAAILEKLEIAEGSELSGFQIKRTTEETNRIAQTTNLKIAPKV